MLSDKQIEAINMLLEGKQKTQIAKDLGIQRSTLYKWLDNKEFIATMDERRNNFLKQTMDDMKSDVKDILGEVKKLGYTAESESVRLQALNSILDRVLGRASTKTELSIEKTTEKDIDLKELDTLLDNNSSDNDVENAIDNVIELNKAK